MTPQELRSAVLEFLCVPHTCTELGEHLWHQDSVRNVNRQSYARPAGKLIRKLIDENLVCRVCPVGCLERPPLYQVIKQG